MLEILYEYFKNTDKIFIMRKFFRILFLMSFPAVFLLGAKFVYLVETEFRYSQSVMDLVSILILFFLLIFGAAKFLKGKCMVGVFYILSAYFIYLSLSGLVTFEVRKAAGSIYISNNSNIVDRIKFGKNIYYLDVEKEREAVFFDSDGALRNGAPSNDWLKHNAEFNACPFWAIPIDKDVYLINFACKGF